MTDLPTITLEAKKDGLRQMQDGTAKLTLTVNSEDMNAAISALWAAPMGTRYQVVMVEIGDDEEPVDRSRPQPGDRVTSVKGYAKPPLTESQRCALLCQDGRFQRWLSECYPGTWDQLLPDHNFTKDVAASVVRSVLGLTSRSEIDGNDEALDSWKSMLAQYETDTGLRAHQN